MNKNVNSVLGLLIVALFSAGIANLTVDTTNAVSGNIFPAQAVVALGNSPATTARSVIYSITPNNGPLGSSITIYGSNFNPTNNSIYYVVGNTRYSYLSNVPSYNGGTVIGPFNTPSSTSTLWAAGPQMSWGVDVQTPDPSNTGNNISNMVAFYIRPTISSISFSATNTSSTTKVTIYGNGFYNNVDVYYQLNPSSQLTKLLTVSSSQNGTQISTTLPIALQKGMVVWLRNDPSGYFSAAYNL